MNPENPALSLLVVFGLAVLIPGLFMSLSALLGPRRPSPEKDTVYECGIRPRTDARHPFPAKFYLTAVFFILFDIEVAFIYPWAVNCRDLGVAGLAGIVSFILVLGVGLVYLLRKGALRWD